MFQIFLVTIGILALTACSTSQVGPPSNTTDSTQPIEGAQTSSSSKLLEPAQPDQERETHNVTYRGIVQPAGISIYMQGSHRLVLPDGRFILLESKSVDLNGYVGEEVEISGSTRSTIETNGIIMRVEKAKLILPPKEDSDPSAASSGPSGESEDAEESEAASASSSKANTSSLDKLPSRVTPSVPGEAEGRIEGGQDGSTRDDTKIGSPSANPAVIEAMANEKFAPEQWTQEYCTSHIGFCIPVHRNWWYKSFGTTTSTLWHIEVGNSPVLNLGDGPIIINLLPGELALENEAITDIHMENDMVVASRSWSGNRHFEIRASLQLESAVRYMIEHISSYEGN